MIWLNTHQERHHAHVFRVRNRMVADAKLFMQLTVEAVHPGNLGPLPPSPEMLLWKAAQIGLLTSKDEHPQQYLRCYSKHA